MKYLILLKPINRIKTVINKPALSDTEWMSDITEYNIAHQWKEVYWEIQWVYCVGSTKLMNVITFVSSHASFPALSNLFW